jgi:hypothetical protein
VQQTRGWHERPFCPPKEGSILAERDGEHLRLGTFEIRIFSAGERTIYAAPTLICHYVDAHHYEPPIEFRRAVLEGYSPGDQRYFEALAKHQLEWNWTSSAPGRQFRLRAPQ